jgi:hypothetical protein
MFHDFNTNFLLAGDRKSFQNNIVKPIQKSLQSRQRIKDLVTQQLHTHNQKQFLQAIDLDTKGIHILHQLHKEVVSYYSPSFCCRDCELVGITVYSAP